MSAAPPQAWRGQDLPGHPGLFNWVPNEPRADRVVDTRRAHRAEQATKRLAREPGWSDFKLVLAAPNGGPWWPSNFDRTWRRFKKKQKIECRFHDLRHTQATQLLGAGVHPKVVSERLGHASIGITLDTCSLVMASMQEEAVGSRWAGRFRIFRNEVRCWRDGFIPDLGEAVDSPQRLPEDEDSARRLLRLAPHVPTPVWGRSELRAGDMWNSNSIISWLLVSSSLDEESVSMPSGGRAPGWDAGLVVARRQGPF